MKVVVDVVSHVPFQASSDSLRATARRALEAVRRVEASALSSSKGRGGARRSWPAATEVALISAGVRRMRTLNLRHRGKDRPTDVLSFPMEPHGRVGTQLGDIVLCPAVARANARRAGRSYRSELSVLVLHGLLHLLGYDHETDQGQMAALERDVRRAMGLVRLGDEEML